MFNKQFDFKALRADITDALEQVEKKYGIKFEQGAGSYDADKFSMKLTATDTSIDLNRKQFEESCLYYGLKPEDYGAVFTADGVDYRIDGINTRAPKKPILISAVFNGAKYNATEVFVKRGLHKTPLVPVKIGDNVRIQVEKLECTGTGKVIAIEDKTLTVHVTELDGTGMSYTWDSTVRNGGVNMICRKESVLEIL